MELSHPWARISLPMPQSRVSRLMQTWAICGLLMITGTSNAEAVVIYDTFDENHQAKLFDCCHAWPVATQESEAGFDQAVAIPFTAPADGHITRVGVALSWFSGEPDYLIVVLLTDVDGLPGFVKGHSLDSVGPIPPPGRCCVYQTGRMHGSTVKAGQRYWLEVVAKGDAYGGWNLNSLGVQGIVATKGEDNAWKRTTALLPAVSIYMK